MGTYEKLVKRFLSLPNDFSLNELTRLLNGMGYNIDESFAGSRIRYVCEGRESILLHKPHPKDIVPVYAIKIVKKVLKEEGLI